MGRVGAGVVDGRMVIVVVGVSDAGLADVDVGLGVVLDDVGGRKVLRVV